MKRNLIPIFLVAMTVMGCRTLVSPANGYIIIPNVFSPVEIRTSDLEGAGWIKAMKPGKTSFEPIFIEPNGAFVYNEPLPGDVWHCADPGGREGCVARLQVGDEKGVFPVFDVEDNAIYVCTEDYVQKMGRKHCGRREFVSWSFIRGEQPEVDTFTLPKRASWGPVGREVFTAPSPLYSFHGDPTTRLISGDATFPGADDYNPPPEEPDTGMWHEQPWTPGEPIIASVDESLYVADIGMCSIFLPLKWEDRMNDLFSTAIGIFTEERGIAEILIDGMLEDDAPPTIRQEQDVFLWADASAVITTRKDVSPEVHFRLAPAINGQAALKPQLGVKVYMTVSNDLNSGIEDWYRWDQGFLSALASLFNIGSCKPHKASLMYFGEIGIKDGHGFFRTAKDPVASVEDYSVFKPACRNTFVPKVTEGLKEGAQTAGAENFSAGVDRLVQRLQEYVQTELKKPAFVVRDLVLTSSGIYVVTAKSISDPQYKLGLGNCIGDLQAPKPTPATQPKIHPTYSNRGITREIP